MSVLEVVTAPWAILPEMLLEIREIYVAHARGEKADLSALEARLGRPLANERPPYQVDNGVAIIPVDGPIAQRMNMMTAISGGTSTQLLARDLKQAAQDPNVSAIVLTVDSPGGTVAGTDTVAALVREIAAQKPVVTWSDGVMASAAYWIGAAADAVFVAGETTQVGSIGVVATHVDISRAQEAAGVKTTEITAGKYKRIASQYEPLSKEGRATLQEQVDYLYAAFVDAVAGFRGVAPDQVLADMADGRIFIGSQAVSAGLVDGIASLDALVSDLARGTYQPRRTLRGASIQSQREGSPMTTQAITLETIVAEHPAIAAALADLGAAAERQRIQDVEAQSLPGHEALIASLKFDGTTSGPQAAAAVLAAERTLRQSRAKALADDAPEPLPAAPSAAGAAPSPEAAEASLPLEERCKARWERNADGVRSEFTSLEAYTAFAAAESRGRIRILKK